MEELLKSVKSLTKTENRSGICQHGTSSGVELDAVAVANMCFHTSISLKTFNGSNRIALGVSKAYSTNIDT